MSELEKDLDGDAMMQWLSSEIITEIFKYLNSPKDLAHAACVSRAWRKYVLEGNLWRCLCIKSFPELAMFEWVDDGGKFFQDASAGMMRESMVPFTISRESYAYKHLLHNLLSPSIEDSVIMEALHASSTDHPTESIDNTLDLHSMTSYWSSQGERSTEVPETLTYLLQRRLCVIHKIKIQPFEANFQYGSPIYSAKAVRFRFGYPRSQSLQHASDALSLVHDRNNFNDYVWTYVSPEFPMEQKNSLQSFELPHPVLCIGGVLQIELLGRVQIQDIDRLYYICVLSVSAHGKSLRDFDFEPIFNEKKYRLKFDFINQPGDRLR